MNFEYLLQVLRDRFYTWTKQTRDCWKWKGLYGSTGNPRVFIISRWMNAQDVSYLLSHGDIPKGYRVKASCENIFCVRPEHLMLEAIPVEEPVLPKKSYKVSQIRGVVSGSHRGRKSKITEEMRAEILRKWDARPENQRWGYQAVLAQEFGVTGSTISQIIKAGRESLEYSSQQLTLGELAQTIETNDEEEEGEDDE